MAVTVVAPTFKVPSGPQASTSLGTVTLEEAQEETNPHKMRIMGEQYPVEIEGGPTTTIDLAMTKTEDAQGLIRWRNMGKRYDNYRTRFNVYTDQSTAALLEQNIKNRSLNVSPYPEPSDTLQYYFSIESTAGFWLFSQYFDINQEIEFAAEKMETRGNFDFFGKLTQFQFTAVPRYRDIYSNLNASPAIDSCYQEVQGIKIGDVWLPAPQRGFRPVLNEDNAGDQLHGEYSTVTHAERPQGEIFTATFRLDEEYARRIIEHFVTVRSAIFNVEFGAGYYPFGKDYAPGVYEAVIGSTQIRIRHTNLRNVEVTFSIQVQGNA